MSREIREVKDAFDKTTFLIYCNTIDLYVVNFDFETREAAKVFKNYWERMAIERPFIPDWQGTAKIEDVKQMIKEHKEE